MNNNIGNNTIVFDISLEVKKMVDDHIKQHIVDWEQVKIQIYNACKSRFQIAVYNWSATASPFPSREFCKYHDGVVIREEEVII